MKGITRNLSEFRKGREKVERKMLKVKGITGKLLFQWVVDELK